MKCGICGSTELTRVVGLATFTRAMIDRSDLDEHRRQSHPEVVRDARDKRRAAADAKAELDWAERQARQAVYGELPLTVVRRSIREEDIATSLCQAMPFDHCGQSHLRPEEAAWLADLDAQIAGLKRLRRARLAAFARNPGQPVTEGEVKAERARVEAIITVRRDALLANLKGGKA